MVIELLLPKMSNCWRPLSLPCRDFLKIDLDLAPIAEVQGEKEKIKTIIKNRSSLSNVDLHMPDGGDIRMNGLRKFASVVPLYRLEDDGLTLINNSNGEIVKPNMDVGYYQPVDQDGAFIGNTISPGFIVNVSTANFERSFGKTTELKSLLLPYSSGPWCFLH